jgi:hypothetical protein
MSWQYAYVVYPVGQSVRHRRCSAAPAIKRERVRRAVQPDGSSRVIERLPRATRIAPATPRDLKPATKLQANETLVESLDPAQDATVQVHLIARRPGNDWPASATAGALAVYTDQARLLADYPELAEDLDELPGFLGVPLP